METYACISLLVLSATYPQTCGREKAGGEEHPHRLHSLTVYLNYDLVKIDDQTIF
jgi:hypothetical protein